ncbi:MAG: DNA-processing protein DprA [Pseudomonadota bacterium]
MTMKQTDTLPWLALRFTRGVGNLLFKRLIEQFGNPETVFSADTQTLKTVQGMTLTAVENIQGMTAFSVARKEESAILRAGYSITTMNDGCYPALLKQIPDPPPVLTYLGTLDNESPCVAIVGSRKATTYGLTSARKLSAELASMGFQIVSGMAYGIDSAAHTGALEAGGRTLAVMGSGLATVYPKSNRGLFRAIQQSGAVISEFSVQTAPEPQNFPIRNRVIAGMSAGCVVVEAAVKSGSLITARLSAEYGREVFAVPGSIHSTKSSGTHALIKQGATLIGSSSDILEQLHHMVHLETPARTGKENRNKPGCGSEPDGLQRMILDVLDPYPMHIDDIIKQSGLDNGGVCAALLDLELSGLVRQSPGKRFSIIEEQK